MRILEINADEIEINQSIQNTTFKKLKENQNKYKNFMKTFIM